MKQIRLKDRKIKISCCEDCPINDEIFLCQTTCKSGCYLGEDFSVCKKCPLEEYEDGM